VHRIIPSIDETCSRCGRIENENHIFFECSFARAVWFGSVLGLRADALPSSGHGLHIQVATILQQGQSLSTTGLIFSIMWCLWKSRNDHRFNNAHWSVARVLHEAVAIDRSYSLAMEEDLSLSNTPAHQANQQCLHLGTRPATVTIQLQDGPKIFCDASVCTQPPPNANQTGIGIFILTNPTNSVCNASFLQVAVPKIIDPLEAEAQALLLGAKVALALNLQVASLLTDNLRSWRRLHKKDHYSIIQVIGLSDQYLRTLQKPQEECITQLSRLEEKPTRLQTSSRSRQDKPQFQVLAFTHARL